MARRKKGRRGKGKKVMKLGRDGGVVVAIGVPIVKALTNPANKGKPKEQFINGVWHLTGADLSGSGQEKYENGLRNLGIIILGAGTSKLASKTGVNRYMPKWLKV